MARRSPILLVLLLAGLSLSATAAQAPHEVTVITSGGPGAIPISEFSGAEMVPLRALARLAGAEMRRPARGGVMLSGNGKLAHVSEDKNFVPVADKLQMLQSPARLVSGEWFVPLDFITKVLPSLSEQPLSYRSRERMLVVGDDFPRMNVEVDGRDPSYTRVELSWDRPIEKRLNQTEGEVRLTIEAPFLKTEFTEQELSNGVVEGVTLSRADSRYVLNIRLGNWFGDLRTDEGSRHLELNLLRSRAPTARVQTGEVEIVAEDLRSMAEREGAEAGEESATPEAGEVEPGEGGDEERVGPPPEIYELPTDYEKGTTDLPRLPLAEPTGPLELTTVTLDPGHGGTETGAEGQGGLVEKRLALSLARRVRSLLQERMGLRVILTRDGDRDLSLDERAAVANNNKSDVFISIHADASPRRNARGSSVYFLSYSSSGSDARRVTSAQDRTRNRRSELDFILWDMAQASHLSQSSRLAEILQEELRSATGGGKVNRGIKQNTFRVLKGATMPAVLVEVGFISNPEEERLLQSESYQEQLAEALYRGVLRFKEVYEFEPRAERASRGRK